MSNRDYINEVFFRIEQTGKANPYEINELRQVLNNQHPDLYDAERLCYALSVELSDESLAIKLDARQDNVQWYDILRLHLYSFFKRSDEYRDNQTTIAVISTAVVDNIVCQVSNEIGITEGIIPLVLSLLICVVFKISVMAWCDHFYANTVRGNTELELLLKKMEDKK